MEIDIGAVFKKSVAYSQKQYNRHYKIINSVCAVPFLVLKKIEIYDLSINLIVILAVVYASALIFKIIYRGEESLKCVLLSCTFKSHPVSAVFWMLLGGLAAMGVNKVTEVRQSRIDQEEFNLAYTQYQTVLMRDYVQQRDDCVDFVKGYECYQKADYDGASKYLKKASAECAYASFLYADMLYRGLGIDPDKYEALKYYAKAAEKEVMEAKLILMIHYFEENDNAAAESYARDILDKIYLENFRAIPMVVERMPDQSELTVALEPWVHGVNNSLLNAYYMAYSVLYNYYLSAHEYHDAAYYSELVNEKVFGGASGECTVNKALCMLLDGDRIGARIYLRRIMYYKKCEGEDLIQVEEAYVRHILMPPGKDIKLAIAKDVEELLIKNVKAGSQKSLQLLKELYDRGGYMVESAQMDHLESYYKLSREHERE